jgi:hypothetical protein
LIAGLRSLFRRSDVERDLDEELRAYLDADVDARVRAGAPREDAEREARLRVGGSVEAVKDAVRDVGWESRLEGVWQDARIALRKLRRSPGFAVAIILTLALGIGANTAIFSIIDALLLRRLPVRAPEQLVVVTTRSAAQQSSSPGWNYAIWEQLRQQHDLFDGALAWTAFTQPLDLARGGERQPADGLFVNATFFDELGVQMVAGEGFRAGEDALGSADSRVAVISYGFWQRHFGGAAVVQSRQPGRVAGLARPGVYCGCGRRDGAPVWDDAGDARITGVPG